MTSSEATHRRDRRQSIPVLTADRWRSIFGTPPRSLPVGRRRCLRCIDRRPSRPLDWRVSPCWPPRHRPRPRRTTTTRPSCARRSRPPACSSTSKRSRASPTTRGVTGSPAPPATTPRRTTSRTGRRRRATRCRPTSSSTPSTSSPTSRRQCSTSSAGTSFVPGIAGASLGGDFGSMFKSTPYTVDITAPVLAVDLPCQRRGPPNTSTSGCEVGDYAGMPAGAIIIVQRGTCTFAQKFTLADASDAGGDGVHQRGAARPDRAAVVQLRRDRHPDVRGDGRDRRRSWPTACCSGDTGRTARFKIEWQPGTYTTTNVIAETTGGDPNNVIVVGAHLDSRRRRARHQRQRLRLGDDPGDRRADGEGEAPQQGALHLVRRRGVGPARFRGVRRQPQPGRAGHRSPRC